MAAIFMKSLSTRVSSAEISFLTIASHLNYKVYQRVDLQQTEDLALNQHIQKHNFDLFPLLESSYSPTLAHPNGHG
jgi:hypothetical protein